LANDTHERFNLLQFEFCNLQFAICNLQFLLVPELSMLTRRDFLKSSSLLALAPTIPGFLAQTARALTPRRDSRILVVIELNGGNDGINTVVPYADEGYAKHRKALRLPKEQILKINDRVGLHPAMRGAAKLLETGRLAIVQGVGYPNPNRSHFESMAIWQTARLNPAAYSGPGWLGAALDRGARPAHGAPASLLIGLESPPRALRGDRAVSSALAHLDDLVLAGDVHPRQAVQGPAGQGDLRAFVHRSMLDAYATADRLKEAAAVRDGGAVYPGTGLAERLRLMARVIKAGFGTRVFYAIQPGYDTHYSQPTIHDQLLGELSGAVRAFLDDVAAAKLADRVVVLCFSEFGRRVAENDSQGTDHGTAGPVLVAGPGVKAGLVGITPTLTDLDGGDLKTHLDFRRVYATVLDTWLGLPAREALAGRFEPLPLFA
jgi:uncharacterized protein (DUF1501 family)